MATSPNTFLTSLGHNPKHDCYVSSHVATNKPSRIGPIDIITGATVDSLRNIIKHLHPHHQTNEKWKKINNNKKLKVRITPQVNFFQ